MSLALYKAAAVMLDIIGKVLSAAAGLIGGDKGRKVKEAIETLQGEAAVNPAIQKLMIESDLEMRRLALADADGIRKLLMVEVQSEDKFVRRVRPALCWIVVLVIGTYFCIIPLIQTIVVAWGREAIEVAVPDIPPSTATMLASLVAAYMGARSWDKRNKMKFTNTKGS